MSPLRPPSGGTPPPVEVSYRGATLELRPLAQEICRRYRAEFPDEAVPDGDARNAWCVHDNQHILNWAAISVESARDILPGQIAWLARVLDARQFPLVRLVRDIEIAADVVEEHVEDGAALAAQLRGARSSVT